MHTLFVHQNFPAQFGHIASHLAERYGHRCSFVSEKPSGHINGVERIQYVVKGGARETTHFCSRTFENQIWHSAAVFEALRARPDIQPDLIVGHSGFVYGGEKVWRLAGELCSALVIRNPRWSVVGGSPRGV